MCSVRVLLLYYETFILLLLFYFPSFIDMQKIVQMWEGFY